MAWIGEMTATLVEKRDDERRKVALLAREEARRKSKKPTMRATLPILPPINLSRSGGAGVRGAFFTNVLRVSHPPQKSNQVVRPHSGSRLDAGKVTGEMLELPTEI
jgi:hypothetical protein